MTGVDRATAYRDIADLAAKGLLTPTGGRGRAASYEIAGEGEAETRS
jgi:Fic family protein